MEKEHNIGNWDDDDKGRWMFERFVQLYSRLGRLKGDSEIPFDWCVLCDVYNLYPILCSKCQQQPCIVYQDKTFLNEVIAMKVVGGKANNECRFLMYKEFTRRLHGYLGKKNRRELPLCIKHFTREVFPEEDGCYVGYRDTGSV
jgi:hypothetical protein